MSIARLLDVLCILHLLGNFEELLFFLRVHEEVLMKLLVLLQVDDGRPSE